MLSLSDKNNLPQISPDKPPQVDLSYLDHELDFQKIEQLAAKYSFIDTLVLIGHGGSVNTFRGIYQALKHKATPKPYIVDTNEPSYLKTVREALDPKRTLVLSISKSGGNVSQIEATLYFIDFPHKVFVTGREGILSKIAAVDKTIDLVLHPEVGGRFTGFTEVALLPAQLCGFDAKKIRQVLNDRTAVEKSAWEFSQYLWQLENDGHDLLLLSVYGRCLESFGLFVQQIIHETVGKKGLGVTVVPVDSPESQHHTNQRLMDGRRNMAAAFVNVAQGSLKLSVPKVLQNVELEDKRLSDFNELDLATSFAAEYKGTRDRATELQIPNLTIQVSSVNEEALGAYILFWQLTAVYSAHLRGVNPFDQPAVEESKTISFKERFRK